MPSTSIGGCSIHYQDMGEGVPVVISPGGRSPIDLVIPLAEALARRCRVILWDRPNLGRSDVAFEGGTDIDMWVDQLHGLLRVLGTGPAYLAAASSGARLSLRFAHRYPDAVRGLFLWLLTGGPVADVLAVNYYGDAARIASEQGMASVAAMPYWVERIRANPANRGRMMAQDPAVFAATMRRWALAMRADDVLIGLTDDDLRRIGARTRLVASAGDAHHDGERTRRVAQLMPNAGLIDPPSFSAAWTEIRGRVPVGTGYELIPVLPDLIADFVAED